MGMGRVSNVLSQVRAPQQLAPTLRQPPPGGLPYGRTPVGGQSVGRTYVPNQFSSAPAGGAMTFGPSAGPFPGGSVPARPPTQMMGSIPNPSQQMITAEMLRRPVR